MATGSPRVNPEEAEASGAWRREEAAVRAARKGGSQGQEERCCSLLISVGSVLLEARRQPTRSDLVSVCKCQGLPWELSW